MANSLPAVSVCREIFLRQQHLSTETNLEEYSPTVANPFPMKKFCVRKEKLAIFWLKELHLTEWRVPSIIMCTSLLWRANKPGVGTRSIKDGAKIYFCNRRSCILTGKRRSCLLDRLSPRKSRFQSHPAKMRSVPER